jgi:hypothetical protein
MAGSSNKLGARQEAAILALLTSRGVEEAARTANVSPRALYRWLKDPEFSEQYRRAKRDAFGQAVARLQRGTGAAAAVMLKLMVDPGVPASTRLRAADCVLTHAKNAIEIEEIEARLAELERRAEESSDPE